MKAYLIYFAIAILMSGCGGGGGSGDVEGSTYNISEGTEVFINPGDSVVQDTEDTEIVVSHYLNNTKSIRVLKGSITLLLGNYDVN